MNNKKIQKIQNIFITLSILFLFWAIINEHFFYYFLFFFTVFMIIVFFLQNMKKEDKDEPITRNNELVVEPK